MSVIFMPDVLERAARSCDQPRASASISASVGNRADAFLRELELAVDRNLEHPAARADEFDISLAELRQSCPRTEGFGLVASTAAVVDDDFHRVALLAADSNSPAP